MLLNVTLWPFSRHLTAMPMKIVPKNKREKQNLQFQSKCLYAYYNVANKKKVTIQATIHKFSFIVQ